MTRLLLGEATKGRCFYGLVVIECSLDHLPGAADYIRTSVLTRVGNPGDIKEIVIEITS